MRLPAQALQKLGLISVIISLPVLIGSPSAWAATLLKTAGTLSKATDSRLEDGSLYDTHKFSGTSGQQVTIILESRDFDPYLILVDPSGERIAENDDISRGNLNAKLVINLPSTGTYTVYANSYDTTKGGQYNVIVRINDSSAFPIHLSALFRAPSAHPQRSTAPR